MQSALREIRSILTNRRALTLWLAVTAITIVVGPFNTVHTLSLPARLAYWTVVNGSCYLVAASSIALVIRSPLLAGTPAMLRNALGSVTIGIVNSAAIVAINAIVWPGVEGLPGFGQMAAITIPIALVFGVAIAAVGWSAPADPVASPADPAATLAVPVPAPEVAFLRRLPRHLGRDLVSVSVQDHYCEVVTATGRALVLMRFADALDELANAEGMQVHRSHWVAFGAVAGLARSGDGLAVRLADGREIPVSRSRTAAVRQRLRG